MSRKFSSHFFSFSVLNAPLSNLCEDDENWKDSDHGDGLGRCADMTEDWCQNHGDYSTEAKRACPKACGVCQGRVY